jgi:uncharacterized RDD family membrane protein YckC
MDLLSGPPLADVLRRFGAVLLDGLLAVAIGIPAGILGLVISTNPPTSRTDAILTVALFVILLTIVGLMSYSALIYALWAYGLTPGKWMLGIRVVNRDTGLPAGFWRMALRQIVGQWISAVVCYLGFIWVLFDANRQGWHDKIANTLVVRTS